MCRSLFLPIIKHTAWPHIGFPRLECNQRTDMYPELEKVINHTAQGVKLCTFPPLEKVLHTNTHFHSLSFNNIFFLWFNPGSCPPLLLRPCKAVVLVPVWHIVSPLKLKPECCTVVHTCEMHDYANQAVYLGLQSISRCPVRFVLKRAAAGGFTLWSGQWLYVTASRTVSAR